MKKIVMLFLAVVALMVSSCSKNEYIVYDNIPATLYISNSGIVEVADLSVGFDVTVVKGGNANYAVNLTLCEDTSPIVSHNIKKNLNFVPLPKECYTLSAESAVLAEEQDLVTFSVAFDDAQVEALPEGSYALSLAIESENANINEDKRFVMLCFEK